MRLLRTSTSVGVIAAALGWLSAHAVAQERGAEAAEDDKQQTGAGNVDNQGALDSIVVTAQRREESLQDAALAVTAVGGDDLVKRGVTDVTQLTTVAPSLQIATTYGPTANFTLRGVGNFVLNVNSDPAIITNIDGVPIARPTGVHGLFYDLERIEVLKGPQGTLYGRNATGGAINVITREPRLGEFSGYVNASYGSYDAAKLEGALNLPVVEDAALRLAASYSRRDGYYSDGTGDEDLFSARATFRAELGEAITLTIGGDYTHMGGRGPGGTVMGLPPFTGLEDPLSAGPYEATLSFPTGAFFDALTDVPGHRPQYMDNSMYGLYGLAELETPIGVLSIQPAYRQNDLDYQAINTGFHSVVDETNKQTSLEVRVVSDSDGPLDYIVGAFYMDEDNESILGFAQQFFGAYGEFSPISEAIAGYARLTYSLTSDFRVSLAGRYTSDKRGTFQDVATGGPFICPGLFQPEPSLCLGAVPVPAQNTPPPGWVNGAVIVNNGGSVTPPISATPFSTSETFNKFTWRAGLEYDVSPDSLLYASFETGFKAGGFYATPDPDKSFGPETVEAFTVGSKNRFLNDRLQLNVEGFWWTYDDYQYSHFLGLSSGGVTFGTENVGSMRMRGLEIEALGRMARDTTLDLTVQYLDAEMTDFLYEEPPGAAAPVTGCPFTANPDTSYTVNCSGRKPPYAPTWTLQGGVEQVFPLGNGGEIVLDVDGRYQSSQWLYNSFQSEEFEKGHATLDLYITYNSPDYRYFVTAFMKNATNTTARSYASYHPRAADSLWIDQYIPPRTYGVRVGAEF